MASSSSIPDRSPRCLAGLGKLLTETVAAVKRFLDPELEKCETVGQFNESIKLVETKSQFDKLKQTGVGQTTMLKFLGDPWKQWMVQEALDTLRRQELPVSDGGVSRKAVDMLAGVHKKSRPFRETAAVPCSCCLSLSQPKALTCFGLANRPFLMSPKLLLLVKNSRKLSQKNHIEMTQKRVDVVE